MFATHPTRPPPPTRVIDICAHEGDACQHERIGTVRVAGVDRNPRTLPSFRRRRPVS